MTHKDRAPETWQADHHKTLDELGIRIEPLGEEMLTDREARRGKWNYKYLLRYNARKKEVALEIIDAWMADHPFEFEALHLVREALATIPDRVADIEVEWYREEHKKRAAKPKHRIRKFEPSFGWFPALFEALRVAKAGARGEVLTTIRTLADPLTAFSSNDFPVAALGFTPLDSTDLKARRAAKTAAKNTKKAAKLQAENAATAKRLETTLLTDRHLHRRSIAPGGALSSSTKSSIERKTK